MTIKKFSGKTREEAMEAAKAELGDAVVIMNVKEVRPKGVFGFLKNSTYEVTAAVEDEVMMHPFTVSAPKGTADRNNFNAVADEKIVIAPQNERGANEALRDAFQAVNEVIEQNQSVDSRTAGAVQTESVRQTSERHRENRREDSGGGHELEQRLENLQSLLETKLSDGAYTSWEAPQNQNRSLVKMIYNVLLEHEVHEKYVNQILEDAEKVMRSPNGLDNLLSNVYQKMILKMGQPRTITLGSTTPMVVFFIGPTGVGKTTTIAKLASRYKVEYGKKVALLTADTYRIAAAEQLRTYASILDTPLSIIYAPQELDTTLKKMQEYDLVLVDTAGFSHKNDAQRQDMERLLGELDAAYQREVYLVLSATTKYKDLKDIVDIYRGFTDFHLIFTKLDETDNYGNILNIRLYANAPLSYVTTGQNVPDDIEIVDPQKMVRQLLGG